MGRTVAKNAISVESPIINEEGKSVERSSSVLR